MTSPEVVLYEVTASGETGALLGFGSLVDWGFVVAHPQAARLLTEQLSSEATSAPRIRCQISDRGTGTRTFDGVAVLSDTAEPEREVGIELDHAWPGEFDSPGVNVHQPAATIAEAVAALVRAAAANDPGKPSLPPPAGADDGEPGPPTGDRPFYCRMFSNAPGCH